LINPKNKVRTKSAFGWLVILLLLAWVPSCGKTEKDNQQAIEPAEQGAPLDAPLPLAPPANPDPDPTGITAITEVPLDVLSQADLSTTVNNRRMPDLSSFTPNPLSANIDVKSVVPTKRGDYSPLSFAFLSSFEYDVPDPFTTKTMKAEQLKKLSDQIPEYIKILHEKKITLTGFMVPIDVVEEGVKSFILTYNQMMCCFGQMPWYNEWVYVEMPEGKPATYQNDVPIAVSGTLEVGEEIEDGFVISLYRMKGEQVERAGEI
jgi:hypothetical protein